MMHTVSRRSKSSLVSFVVFGVAFFLWLPSVSAQRQTTAEDPGQDSTMQAQATMASLFGRGAKMPSMPRVSGTIALPSFDNSGMKIDEASLSEAQRRRPETRD